jgi:threonine aldolase
MNFRSDNTATVAAEILAALMEVNKGSALAYGDDQWSRSLDEKFSAAFEREVRVFTVATGTAANSISLASAVPPWGSILCHREAHIECDESGAPEFYSGGAKLTLIDGPMAKITPEGVEEALGRTARSIHSVAPSALSISQTTERGAIYRPEEVAVLGELARKTGLAFHMDGARFANAVAALGCKPADVSWRGGVDLLSFGATKNGALAAEAILCFNHDYAEEIARRRKRGGHLLSKNRYVAAQLLAYLENDLWLKLAARANGQPASSARRPVRISLHPLRPIRSFSSPAPRASRSCARRAPISTTGGRKVRVKCAWSSRGIRARPTWKRCEVCSHRFTDSVSARSCSRASASWANRR